ncbi:unnamed protein product [Choristocarpus tenellus]
MLFIKKYMDLICKRASGELYTTARWTRDFVDKHPAYKHDSVVPEPVALDLLMELKAIGEGLKHDESLLGDLHIRPVRPKQAYDIPLSSRKVSSACLNYLVEKYAHRERWSEYTSTATPSPVDSLRRKHPSIDSSLSKEGDNRPSTNGTAQETNEEAENFTVIGKPRFRDRDREPSLSYN